MYLNGPLLNYIHSDGFFPLWITGLDLDSVTVNNNLKLRLHAKFSYIYCIFLHKASTSGNCSRELKRNFTFDHGHSW